MNDPILPSMVVVATLSAALGWIIGEVTNRPGLRRVCGPVFTILSVAIAAVICSIHFTISDSLLYSGATRTFVAAVVKAIDEGRVEEAHEELRKFHEHPGGTYEGGAFLRWLTEPTERLNSPTLPTAERSENKSPQHQ